MKKRELCYCHVCPTTGIKTWYKNDIVHRDGDRPAIEEPSGTKEWFVNGKTHRDNGHAVEFHYPKNVTFYPKGAVTRHWYQHGKQHRENGPAVEEFDGGKFWFLNGIQYDLDEYIKKSKMSKKDKVMFKLKWGN